MKSFILITLLLFTIKLIAQNNCLPPTAQTDLDINTVRATILNGGDMWRDLSYNRGYEVPKGSGKHSLFSGAIWIGGLDQTGQLKIAAQTFRLDTNFQSVTDFWSGPLNVNTGNTSLTACNAYDRHWKLSRQEVLDFINTGIPTQTILDYPGNGNPFYNHTQFLAPFFDTNADGIYDPLAGDYPHFDFGGNNCKDVLLGDQNIWWVFNDVGNIHGQSGGVPIGFEVYAQAYAYSSFDEAINNSTFYQYKIINRSSTALDSTYVGLWTNLGIGNYIDDNAGCDVGLNLAYGYNNDSDDDGIIGYGLNPPAVGVKILDGINDDYGNLVGMSKFSWYDNDFSVTGNPENQFHFYNYLRAVWKDNSPLTYGGSGYGGTIPTNYAFPDSSDPAHTTPWIQFSGGTQWSRRLVQSSGPFTFQPGEVQVINSSVVWARADSGGPIASLHKLKTAAATVQNYFDNCFFAVGMYENAILNGIKLFPNPSLTGKIILNNVPHGSEISVYNLEGKLMDNKIINSNIYEWQNKIEKGIYFVKIKYKEAVKTMKWVSLD